MLQSLRKLLNGRNITSSEESVVLNPQVLAGALFAQMAVVDHDLDDAETATIRSLLQITFSLAAESVDEVLAEAKLQAERSTSLYEFTSALNRSCTPQEKYQIILGLWQIAYADGRLDKYEEHFVRRAAELLHIHHTDFIRAKLEVSRVTDATTMRS